MRREKKNFLKKCYIQKIFTKEMNSTRMLKKDSRGHHFVEFSLPVGLYKRKVNIN